MKAIYLLDPAQFDNIYGPEERQLIASLVEMDNTAYCRNTVGDHFESFTDVEAIFSGWGMPRLDEKFLRAFPALKVIFYGAGSIRGFMTELAWERGLTVCSAWASNAVPVAEFNLAQILLATKRVLPIMIATRHQLAFPPKPRVAGNYLSTVGIVSLGMTGRLLREYLRPFSHHVIAYDPFLSPEKAAELDVELVSLEALFERSDVVSLNTPLLPETIGMITGPLLASMRPNATFINTARGAIVDEPAMVEVLHHRPDLFAVLDVTHPEPAAPDSPLYTLQNVALTPHVAGSQQHECRRMGQAMVDDCRRYLANEPLRAKVSREAAATMA